MKNLLNISKIMGAVVSILVACWFFGEPFLEDYIDLRLDQKVIEKTTSDEFLNTIMTSPFMIDYKRHEKEETIKEALHKGDSTKVKLSANLIAKTGMNKEAMAVTLASIITNWGDAKGFINNKQCIKNAKTYGRARMTSAEF